MRPCRATPLGQAVHGTGLAVPGSAPGDDDVEFAFGLDLTLDGLERVRAGG
jgi:hypothetical protein